YSTEYRRYRGGRRRYSLRNAAAASLEGGCPCLVQGGEQIHPLFPSPNFERIILKKNECFADIKSIQSLRDALTYPVSKNT
ncbi:MAG: hypothetical protein RSD49_21535, partial [Hafnia sp.]